jgi:hypothetical protein
MIMIPSKAIRVIPSPEGMAEEVLGKLAGGAEFERMAQIYSEDSTRDVGGIGAGLNARRCRSAGKNRL